MALAQAIVLYSVHKWSEPAPKWPIEDESRRQNYVNLIWTLHFQILYSGHKFGWTIIIVWPVTIKQLAQEKQQYFENGGALLIKKASGEQVNKQNTDSIMKCRQPNKQVSSEIILWPNVHFWEEIASFLHRFKPYTFRRIHSLLHGASWLKHRSFEIGHSREHLLKTTSPRHNAAFWVRILRNLGGKKSRKNRLLWVSL